MTYKVKVDTASADVFLTVENLANKDPGLVPGLGGLGFVVPQTDPSVYDVLGRTFRAGIRFKM